MTRIDRRALFTTGSAAAMLASVGISARARPQRGGDLKAALPDGDRSEDWANAPGGVFLQAVRMSVFETLTEIAPDGTLQPGLATHWSSDPAKQRWVLDIRKDVLFHDGTELTPNDVVASLTAFGFRGSEIAGKVVIELEDPDASFPLTLATGHVFVAKAEEIFSHACPTTGTGLYRVVRLQAGNSFLGQRVERHRKDGHAGWFASVEFVAINDSEARANAARDGFVDLSANIDPDHVCSADRVIACEQGVTMLSQAVKYPDRCGSGLLDDMRFVERWWMAT